MIALKQWGGGSVDCIILIAIVSCSIFLSPWFLAMGVLLVMVWLRSMQTHAVQTHSRRQSPVRSATVLYYPANTQESSDYRTNSKAA